MNRWTLAGVACYALAFTECQTVPSQLPSDLEKEGVCVIGQLASGVTSIPAIAQACTAGEEAIAADLVEWALHSLTVQQKVGQAVERARQDVAHWRVVHAPPAK